MTVQDLPSALAQQILVLDGAMGTSLQGKHLTASDFGGESYLGCNEHLSLTCPQVIADIHCQYLDCGANIIETNTFGATPLVLAEYQLQDKTHCINQRSAELARDSISKYRSSHRPLFVAGSIGPTTKSLSITGGVSFQSLSEHFKAQAVGLITGGVDYLLIETAQDTRNIKAAVLGIHRAFDQCKATVPIAVSVTIEANGTMLAGQSIEALYASLAHLDLLYIGLNCATGPEFMVNHIRSLARLSATAVACVPNAGLPDADGRYLETPQMFARTLTRFFEEGWLNLVGGCCGTTPAHIKAISTVAQQYSPRIPCSQRLSFVSGLEYLEIDDEKRPILVGERTNVIGSRKFKKCISNRDFAQATDIARQQIKMGAQIIDVCLANPDQDEYLDMESFLQVAAPVIKAPLMIDSTDPRVIELALTYAQGKSIINSINLEEGTSRFEAIVPLAKLFGAALVVGTIDDDPIQGMGIDRQRKLAIAERSYDILQHQFAIPAQDIYWDVLTFPCGTGDTQYLSSAVETIEGITLVKKNFPGTKTILGISNVSFGLPPAGREVLNSVFLYHCVQAGLDLAIVNTGLIKRYASIPPDERQLCEDLLWSRSGSLEEFVNFYRHQKAIVEKKSDLPLETRLARYIIEGTQDGLIADLEVARQQHKPLEIINGPLMDGMDTVGKLFNSNELIVAEVLQSAEVMKKAVSYLEPFMEKTETSTKAKLLLATVRGDVHDIGKNLVDIILSNNGYKVINLGIKIPSQQLIIAFREHTPDMIGLSGLLVKSAHEMVTTAQDLSQVGINVPLLVGGAALSQRFTHEKINPAYQGSVYYAADAMQGLDIANKLTRQRKERPSCQPTLLSIDTKSLLTDEPPTDDTQQSVAVGANTQSDIGSCLNMPKPLDWHRHVLNDVPLEQVWSFINPRMLFGRHLGLKNSVIDVIAKGDHALDQHAQGKQAKTLLAQVTAVKDMVKTQGLLQPKAIFQFFPAIAQQQVISILDHLTNKPLVDFAFPRQIKAPFLCLSDFVSPIPNNDNICLFVVTAGHGVRQACEKLKESGSFLHSHILAALALETAEALAEWLHKKIRQMWHFPDESTLSHSDLFKAKYRGKRYSFGYPACPDLSLQRPLFEVLKPEDIGVTLSEIDMMDPEASVSAMVLHHPQATYFTT